MARLKIVDYGMGGVSTEVIGLPNVIKRLRDRLGRFKKGALDGNLEAGLLILREANEIVPVDEGRLRRSGFVRKRGYIVTIGYDVDYAMIVHEMVDYAHGQDYNDKYAAEIASGATYTHTPTGETRTYHTRRPQERAKFLEIAARRNTLAARNVIRKTTINRLLSGSGSSSLGMLARVAQQASSEFSNI